MHIETLVVGYVKTNCYIVYDDSGNAVVIDPGENARAILDFLDRNSLKLRYIFLTHGHFDHILAVPDLKDATGAKVVISEADAACLQYPEKSLAGYFRKKHRPVTPDMLANDGDTFEAGEMKFTYLLTPGHTPGSAVIMSGNVLFTGDTLFEDDCGRCDLPGGDYSEMLRSLRRLYALEGDYDVYPGHDVKTTLSRERIHNVNMREAVETMGSAAE
jgi:glyoxylase-like metal-dependent hydrolase (beta-lactamase superfamily II)